MQIYVHEIMWYNTANSCVGFKWLEIALNVKRIKQFINMPMNFTKIIYY
jgi:hypothetical protein